MPQKFHLSEVGVVKGGSTLLPGTYCRRLLLQRNIIQFNLLALKYESGYEIGHTVSARRSLPENGPGSPTPSCSYCDASCFLLAQRLASPAPVLGGAEASLMGEQHLGLKYFVIQLTFQQYMVTCYPRSWFSQFWGRTRWKAREGGGGRHRRRRVLGKRFLGPRQEIPFCDY